MTDNASKPVAKSLHTITVIQQVAALHIEMAAIGIGGNKAGALSRETAVKCAMETLGLAGREDPYGLADKALRLWK